MVIPTPSIKDKKSRQVSEGNIEALLIPDENVCYLAELHWITFYYAVAIIAGGVVLWLFSDVIINMIFPFFAGTGLTSGINSLLATALRLLGIGMTILGVLFLFYDIVRHYETQIIVTDQRVIYKQGSSDFRIHQVLMIQLMAVEIYQSFSGRTLGYGDIYINGGNTPPIPFVAKPYDLVDAIMKVKQEQLSQVPQMTILPPEGGIPIQPR